jgi:hypothetical protein
VDGLIANPRRPISEKDYSLIIKYLDESKCSDKLAAAAVEHSAFNGDQGPLLAVAIRWKREGHPDLVALVNKAIKNRWPNGGHLIAAISAIDMQTVEGGIDADYIMMQSGDETAIVGYMTCVSFKALIRHKDACVVMYHRSDLSEKPKRTLLEIVKFNGHDEAWLQ